MRLKMQKPVHQIYSFDEFTLDLTRGSLLRGAEEIKLRPKSFEVLKYLAENGGRLISKDELIETVWQGMAVSDGSLVQCLIEIRQALDDKSQEIIRTVPRRGYIFEKEVSDNGAATIYTEETAGVHLVIEETEETNGHGEGTSQQQQLAVGRRSLIGTVKRHKFVTALALTALLVTASGIAYGVFVFLRRPAGPPFKSVSIKQVTTDGKSGAAVISPNGNYVAFENQDSLWVRQVAAVNPTQIAPPNKKGYGRKVFSPDSNFIYYQQSDVLYQIPVLGGTPRKILEDVKSAAAFSPDGKRLAFVRGGEGEQKLILANADGSGEEQTLAVRKLPEFFILPVLGNTGPAWSPDGTIIVCPGGDGGGFGESYPVAVSVADGTQKPITKKHWNAILQMAWLADGSGFLMNAKDNGTDATRQIWHVSYPNGVPQRIYNDDNEYDTLSLSANSDKLVSVRREVRSNIWVIEFQDDPTNVKQITFGTGQDGYWGLDTTPDGKVVYDSRAGGERDLWIMDADGGNQRQLTNDALMEAFARISPDGRQIVFHLGGKGLWKMDLDGTNRKQLTDGGMFPTYSPDGNWILYTKPKDKWSMWKISSDGGDPVRLTDHPAYHPAISPDGKWIAYKTNNFSREPVLRIIPFDGGEPFKEFAINGNPTWGHIEWTPDSKAITDKRQINEAAQIVSQPLDGGEPKVLVSLKTDSESIRGFAWSRDGKQLFFASGPVNSNVVMFDLVR